MPLLAFLPFVSTLLGGLLALRRRHRIHPFMAFAGGVLVSAAVAELLPEAHALLPSETGLEIGAAAVAGFLVFTALEAFIHQASFEHEDARTGASPLRPPAHGAPRPLFLLPPASLILHSLLDGLAIGVSFQVGSGVGVVVLLAVLAHDFADGMNVVTLATRAAGSRTAAAALLVLDALAPVAGAGLSVVLAVPAVVLALLLGGFAGIFIAIGAGHLIPEAQHHRPAAAPGLVALAGVGAAAVILVRWLAG